MIELDEFYFINAFFIWEIALRVYLAFTHSIEQDTLLSVF